MRFSLQNDQGEVSAIEGVVQAEQQFPSINFSFDPKSGEQRIVSSCVRLAQAVTAVRPRVALPAGGQVHLAKGFVGVMNEVELERGLYKVTASGAGGTCSSTMERMDEE